MATITAPLRAAPLRQLTATDTLLTRFDQWLKSSAGPHTAQRPYPGEEQPETVTDPAMRRQIADLMRVNHAGEICAQALYHGQASTAKHDEVRQSLQQAAQEEVDHLAWCAQRLKELNDQPSRLDPLWYAGSYCIGALAGLSGDRYSLGFVAETENQVIEHLQTHLNQLPQDDARTRAVLTQMMRDEAQHGHHALEQGGELPPTPIKWLMKMTAKIMTHTAQYI